MMETSWFTVIKYANLPHHSRNGDSMLTEAEALQINVGDRLDYRGRSGTVRAVQRQPESGSDAFRARFDLDLDNGDGLHGVDYRTLSISGPPRRE
jgi:hypothetical protein